MSVGNLTHEDDGERDAAVYHLDKAKTTCIIRSRFLDYLPR